jgi:two-component system, NarL family, sensor histidine kinase UhpB
MPLLVRTKTPEPQQPRQNLLQRRWYELPVRWQIMISISVISVSAVLFSIALAVVDSRDRVQVEVNSSMELAQRFARDLVHRMAAESSMDDLLFVLPSQLQYVRHARILATNANGELKRIAPPPSGSAEREGHGEAPAWFTRLVAPEVGAREVRVVVGNRALGTIFIMGEPAHELAEVWEEVSRRAVIWLAITAVMLVLLYLVLGRLLDPLKNLTGGMHELEDGRYSTRLAVPQVRELAVIAEQFNTLAEALEKSRAENSLLYRNLIALQEDERRQVANELHDEAGPCLFGITANASSISRLADKTPEPQASDIKSRIAEMQTMSERLKTINRDLLRRLRPVELGQISLQELIGSLIAGFRRRHPETEFALTTSEIARGYGEAVELTLFRCVQEALTNAMRHGHASRVEVRIEETGGGQQDANGRSPLRNLQLIVHDNGQGFAAAASLGLGLTAMRERVRTIEGTSRIESSATEGTTITVTVPLRKAAGADHQLSLTSQSTP